MFNIMAYIYPKSECRTGCFGLYTLLLHISQIFALYKIQLSFSFEQDFINLN